MNSHLEERSTQPRIMIVDNNDLVRELIREVVRPLTTDVLECRSGEEAVNRSETFQPDWITMDLIMDGIDGLEAAQQIKSKHPKVAIMMIALCDQPGLRQAAAEAGCVAFLTKKRIPEVKTIIESVTSSVSEISNRA